MLLPSISLFIRLSCIVSMISSSESRSRTPPERSFCIWNMFFDKPLFHLFLFAYLSLPIFLFLFLSKPLSIFMFLSIFLSLTLSLYFSLHRSLYMSFNSYSYLHKIHRPSVNRNSLIQKNSPFSKKTIGSCEEHWSENASEYRNKKT